MGPSKPRSKRKQLSHGSYSSLQQKTVNNWKTVVPCPSRVYHRTRYYTWKIRREGVVESVLGVMVEKKENPLEKKEKDKRAKQKEREKRNAEKHENNVEMVKL